MGAEGSWHIPDVNMSFSRQFSLLFINKVGIRTYVSKILWDSWSGLANFAILLTHEGTFREVYRDFQPSLTSSAGPVPKVV